MKKKISEKLAELYASIPKTPTNIDTNESFEELNERLRRKDEDEGQPIENIGFNI